MQLIDLKPLTKRQQEIFDFIIESMANNGAPPTRQEIAHHFGFRSANASEDHLKALHKKGYIELLSGTSRGIMIAEEFRQGIQFGADSAELGDEGMAVIGDVAAGAPIFASQHIQQMVKVDHSLFSDKADSLLKVRGDSMINVGIFAEDLLAIKKTSKARDNEIVVARIDDEVTVKRYYKQGSSVSLLAENDDFLPIEVDLQTQTFAIEGVVVGLIRQGI